MSSCGQYPVRTPAVVGLSSPHSRQIQRLKASAPRTTSYKAIEPTYGVVVGQSQKNKLNTIYFLLIGLSLCLINQSAFGQPPTHASPPVVIRVGISEYQNVGTIYDGYVRLFHNLALTAPKNQPISFQVAVGGYQEVLDWWERKEIDAAILAATPTAMLFKSLHDRERQPASGKGAAERHAQVEAQLQKLKDSYVATAAWPLDFARPLPILQSQLSPEQCLRFHRVIKGQQLAFHTVAVIADKPELKSVKTLAQLVALNKPIKFLYVRPLSVSGYLLPKHFLKSIERLQNNPQISYAFTFQQPQALDRLLKTPGDSSDDGKILVAFVHDGTVPHPPYDKSRLRILQGTDKFDTTPVPHNVLLLNYNIPESFERNKPLLSDLISKFHDRGGPVSFEIEQDWSNNYEKLESLLTEPDSEIPEELESVVTIDDILEELVEYQETTHKPARLALVLSGGGAKCAYQAGAIEAIEAKLEERRRCVASANSSNRCKVLAGLDINLVVGTSGGSINALFVALGTTKNPSQQGANAGRLRKLWMSLDLGALIDPPKRLLFWVSAWFGLVQSLIIALCAILYQKSWWSWRKLFLILPFAFLIEELIVGIIQIRLNTQLYLMFSTLITLTAALAIGILQKKTINRLSLLLLSATPMVGVLVIALFQGAFSGFLMLIIAVLFLVQVTICLAIFGMMAIIKRTKVDTTTWWHLAGWTVLASSIVELLLINVWQWCVVLPAKYHWIDHFMLLQSLPFRIDDVTIPIPVAIGLIMILIPYALKGLQIDWEWDRRRSVIVAALTMTVIAVATIMLAILFERENALTDSAATAAAMADALPTYYSDVVGQRNTGATLNQLRRYSREIIAGNKISRDLVITASRLHSGADNVRAAQLPDDLYFYYQPGNQTSGAPSNERNQFISFDDHNEDKLLETVVGSGTIYPIFPPESLEISVYDKDGQIRPTDVEIVDGGYIHNSPIDAALRWQATHIIVIDASPATDERSADSFQGNIANAFNYLFDQAQNRDQISRGEAEVYVLRPTCNSLHTEIRCPQQSRWNMDLFDFSRSSLKMALAQGWFDVYAEKTPELPVEIPDSNNRKWQASTVPLFVRQADSPSFQDVSEYKPRRE